MATIGNQPAPVRFPDDRTDNERFSGSAAAWAVVVVGAAVFLTALGLVFVSLIRTVPN